MRPLRESASAFLGSLQRRLAAPQGGDGGSGAPGDNSSPSHLLGDLGLQFRTGEQLVSHFGAGLSALAEGEAVAGGWLQLVESDVGPLWFPRYDRFISTAIRAGGSWEADEARLLASLLRPGDCVVNVGANVGYSSLVMAGMVGARGTVLAFEPEPVNFRLLCENVATNDAWQVVPIPSAVGRSTGTTELSVSMDNTGDHRVGAHPFSVASIEVPCVALDELVADRFQVRLVFSDAQGSEPEVLAGASGIIEACRPHLVVEFWPVGMVERNLDPVGWLDELIESGYRMSVVGLPERKAAGSGAEAVALMESAQRDHVTLHLNPGQGRR